MIPHASSKDSIYDFPPIINTAISPYYPIVNLFYYIIEHFLKKINLFITLKITAFKVLLKPKRGFLFNF